MNEESQEVKIARMDERIDTVLHILTDIKKNYVSMKEFKPVKDVVYGVVGLILIAVGSGLVALIIH